MFNEKTKVNNSFAQIKESFLNASWSKIIYQNRVTRLGIVAKTILLLFITSLSAILSCFICVKFSIIISSYFYLLSLLSVIIVFISFKTGINNVEKAQTCSFIYSTIMGMTIGTSLSILNKHLNYVFPLVCIALIVTFLVFLIVFCLYYQGSFKINGESATIKKMYLIAIILFFAEILSFFVFNIINVPNIMNYNFIAIPINLFFILFSVMILSKHLDYVEDIISQSMPKKYEWQLSLAFTSLFINVFYNMLDILIRLFGTNKE